MRRPEYREEPCKSALNRVNGMGFRWSLNPYTGCAHQCTFCYVRAFERRADRPSDDRYGTSIRVKINVADVLERELARRSWKGELVAVGAATDPYQPAKGRLKVIYSFDNRQLEIVAVGPRATICEDLAILVASKRLGERRRRYAAAYAES